MKHESKERRQETYIEEITREAYSPDWLENILAFVDRAEALYGAI